MKRWAISALLFVFLFPNKGFAEGEHLRVMGKRAKVVGKAALYGTGGGVIVGLASQVVKKEAKNILVGGSLGLYAGIILGIYVISSSGGGAPYEGPDTYEDYGDFSLKAPQSSTLVAAGVRPERKVSANFLNLSF